MMKMIVKPWIDREDGRILVVKHNKVIMSKHYRNLKHLETIKNEIKQVIKEF